jgi:hypothetical protein
MRATYIIALLIDFQKFKIREEIRRFEQDHNHIIHLKFEYATSLDDVDVSLDDALVSY